MKKLILSVLFCLISFYSFGYQIDENFTGQVIKKYKNGQVKSIENFKNGKLNGEFKEFFEDGKLSQITNFKNIDIFEKYGVTVKKYGNNCLREAIYDINQELAQMFLEYGADINYHDYEMVFTDNSTPVMVAVEINSLNLVKWLVEKGADITIKNKFGERPYSIAVLNKNQEMIDYIKSLEPVDFHNEETRKSIIKKYKLPKDMIEFFNKGDLKIEFSENIDSKYIEFWKLEDTVELTWKRKKYLSLVKDLENYWLHLLWYPKEKTLYIFDGEHEEIFKIGDWSYFINNCEEIVGSFLD